VRLYRLAADQGYGDARYSLRRCYDKGTGVTKYTSQAVRWYRLAADRGDARAQCSEAYLRVAMLIMAPASQ
jgi:TPR repeat protein